MGKKVYIIGAGASKEAKLPTGDGLKEDIAECLDLKLNAYGEPKGGDEIIIYALRKHASNQGKPEDVYNLFRAAERIRNALPQVKSIDNFINNHKDDKDVEICGKIAIVRTILNAEQNSLLYIDPSNSYNRMDFKGAQNTWYGSFIKLLINDCQKENLSNRLKNLSFIIFNYDRCIEHYLYHSLQNCYPITPDEAAKLVNEIEIYHPYGVVGTLPWQDKRKEAFDYGAKINPEKLLQLASQIKTFTEGTDINSSHIINIRKIVEEADKLVFLGFAFHDLNIKLIAPAPVIELKRHSSVLGTAKGISDSDLEVIVPELCGQISTINTRNVKIRNDLTCFNLFSEYERYLSLK